MRDRDVRNAIQAALLATGLFDAVWIWGLPEDYGDGSSKMSACAIEPVSGKEEDLWDTEPTGGIIIWGVLRLTIVSRAEDPQARDESAELLLNTAMNALNGTSLASLTMPEHTKFASWKWEKPVNVERRITTTFNYRYIVEGWNALGVTP